jgi:hypothetical protein
MRNGLADHGQRQLSQGILGVRCGEVNHPAGCAHPFRMEVGCPALVAPAFGATG